MTQAQTKTYSFYWQRKFSREDIRRRSADLAAMRRGLNAEPGTSPGMWRFYATGGGRHFDAEHHALTLFAVHQQSEDRLVHRTGVPMAAAIRTLHRKFDGKAKFSEEAVDRRFFAAVTAPELDEVAYHLRGLVRQLRSLPVVVPFDYTRLFWDLAGWGDAEARPRTQRRWGLAYYGASTDAGEGGDEATTEPTDEGDA